MHFDIQRFNVAFSNYVTAFVDISLAWYRKITHVESCVDDPNKEGTISDQLS